MFQNWFINECASKNLEKKLELHSHGILLNVEEPMFLLNNYLLRMNENMEFPGISGSDIEWLQEQFVKSIKVIDYD